VAGGVVETEADGGRIRGWFIDENPLLTLKVDPLKVVAFEGEAELVNVAKSFTGGGDEDWFHPGCPGG
jgi:hypothetical protein